MKLLVFVLNKVEYLDELLEAFAAEKIGGATIFHSLGMAHELYHAGHEEDSFLGSLRAFLDPDREESRTIFTVVEDDQVEKTVGVIESIVGDLSRPDTGIVFTLPVDFIKGIRRDKSIK